MQTCNRYWTSNTDSWEIKVALLEAKQVQETQRARKRNERSGKIVHASKEFEVAAKLYEAATVAAKEPVAIQLRYLQSLTEIGVEKNMTVIFPVPIDIFQGFFKR